MYCTELTSEVFLLFVISFIIVWLSVSYWAYKFVLFLIYAIKENYGTWKQKRK